MLGDNIKLFRNKLGLSQQQLADKLHVSRPTISSWELNRTEPNIGTIELLSNIFNCKKSELIGEDPQTFEPIDIEIELKDKETEIKYLVELAKKSDIEEIRKVSQYLRIMQYKTLIDSFIEMNNQQDNKR